MHRWHFSFEYGDDFLIKVLHGHRGDVPELLEQLVGAGRLLVPLNQAQHAEDLIQHLQAGNIGQSVKIKVVRIYFCKNIKS